MVNQETTFIITDTKLYILVVTLFIYLFSFYQGVVTLWSEDNVKLLKQLESGFKRAINWNKYQSKVTQQALNRKLDFLINPSFQGVNSLFVLSFKDIRLKESYKQCSLPTVEIKDYNVMIGKWSR